MDRFVLGFLFNEKGEEVLLVCKNRPEWQKGCLNGIGGKIEINETHGMAMKREGIEETALSPHWELKGVMHGKNNDGVNFECYIFSAFGNIVYEFRQKEDEQLKILPILEAFRLKHISNLEFIIPYLLCKDHSTFIEIHYQQEISY